MSQLGEGGASPESIQVVEIEDQMRNQERLLAQLHESIIAQDKQLLGQEAEAQSYASKLENLKSKHSRDHMSQHEAIPGASVRVSITPKSSGSLTLLRQKVEENRVKVAQRGRQELESKRELEEKVQALKIQLEDMQRVPAAPTTPDQIPVDTQLIALQEQIQAKDSLIEARTRAITLLSEDFSRKRKEVVDQLEETREEMRHMQNKFITCEDYYKAEIQTRDAKLFELDSKVRSLSFKLEQTEELTNVLAENEYLKQQVEILDSIKDEKQCLEDKLKKLSSVLDVHQKNEVEMYMMLEEKQRLHEDNLEKLENLSNVNLQKEKEFSLLQEEKERLYLHNVEQLETLSNLIQLKEDELSLLMEDNQKLEHKVQELAPLFDINRQKEEELSTHVKKNQSLQKRVEKLSRLLAANEKKAKEMTSILNNNQQHEEDLLKEKQSLEKKVEELSQLLDDKQQKERAVSLEKNIILVGADSHEADEMATLLKEKQSLKKELESLTDFLGDIRQEGDLPSQLQPDKLDELIDLARLLYVNDKKVADLHCTLDTNQGEEIGSVLTHEKLQLEQKLEQHSALLEMYRETIKSICTQREESDNFKTQVLEEHTVVENVNKSDIEELSKLIDIIKQHKEKQELLAKAFDALELRVKEQSQLLTQAQLKEEELLNNLCNYETKCKTLTIALDNNEPLQEKVDELSKLLDASQHQHKENLLIIVQEKQLLEERVLELSNIIEANDQNVLAMNKHLSDIEQQHSQELSILFQEKQSLQDKVQELSNIIQADKQDMQVMQNVLEGNQQQHNMEVSVLLKEKELLEIKVSELSGTIATNNKYVQRMEETLKDSGEQHNANLATVLEKTQLLDAKVEDYLQLLKEKEVLQAKVQEMAAIIESNKEIWEKMNDKLSTSEEQHNEALSELSIEKHDLQDKVQKLTGIIEDNAKKMLLMSEDLNTLQQHNEELSKSVTEKHILEENMQKLSTINATNEQNLKTMNYNLSTSEERHYEALSELYKKIHDLQEKVQESSTIIATNEQSLLRMNDNLSTSEERHYEALSVLNNEKHDLQDKVQELSNIIETNQHDLQRLNHNLSSSEERHYEALSVLNKEKHYLEDKVQELSNIIETNQHDLQRLNYNLSSSEERHYEALSVLNKEKHYLEDKVQELSNIIETNEWHVKEINNLLSKNIQRVEELSSLLEIANKDKANQKGEIEQLMQAREHQMTQESCYIKEKEILQDQVAELSDHLNAFQKEKVEEIGCILAQKNNLESEVKRLSNLIEEIKEKHKLSLHKAHKKINDLTRHVNSLEKADDSSVLMVDLQNRIAELEEEKALGVDLTAQVESLQAQKVTAEMKSVELEEELDNLKRKPDYLEDQVAAIDALQSQLQSQVQSYDLLNHSLTKCKSELANKSIEYEKLVKSQRQLEENYNVLREDLAASDAEKLLLRKNSSLISTSYNELVKSSLHVANTMDKFCSDIVNGKIHEMEGESALEMGEIMQAVNIESFFSVQLQELNAKLGKCLPVIAKARASLLSREALLSSLKTELSEACNRTADLDTRLQQLECSENEIVCLKNEVDSLKRLLHEKQQHVANQFPAQVSEEGNTKGSFGDLDLEAWRPIVATRTHLQEHTPGNSVSTTQVYESRIKELEQDKLRLAEELKSAQVRSGKLIKKIKSLKVDYDALVDNNLKLNQDANTVLNDETKNIIDLLEKEVARLQSELRKRDRKMEEASTQADDDQLTWLSNEYESVKLEIQHLIEEIQTKDANLVEVVGELQSKREQWDEVLEEAARMKETIIAREDEVARLEELLRQHTVESSAADTLLLLHQKEEMVAHLEEMLRQREAGDDDEDPPHMQLDQSLYMLHQKEVKCDELTLELMQLLEERDTLQLRLSTMIRQYEELRASCAHEDNKCTSTPSPTPNNSPILSNKLQEVRSMGREQRSMALQQRADATVSRDNQSQSETLINWIRGRATPKVMHI